MNPLIRYQPTRRTLGRYLIQALAISTRGFSQDVHDLGPLKNTPEVKRFKEAQSRLFSSLRFAARSQYLELARPAMKAHIVEAGQGDPAIFLCGGPTVAAFAPMMAAFAGDYHTFGIDRPGSGLSDRLDYRGTPYRDLCVAFMRSVFNKLKIRKGILVGNSMGGYFSLVFALAEPQRVGKIVFLGEVAGSSSDQARPRPTPTGPSASVQPAPVASIEMTKDSLRRVIANVDRVPREIIDVMHTANMMPGINSSMGTMMEQIRRDEFHLTWSLRPEMSHLAIPTLFIWGDQDSLGTPDLGREMARIMPNARCEVLEDAGHLPWLDQPGRCITLASDFIRK
jgi:pimeloyl-ACP methyl ester carboxylesterase